MHELRLAFIPMSSARAHLCASCVDGALRPGKREGKDHGNVAVLLTIIKHHCDFDTAVWVHENVVGFDEEILTRHCSRKWFIVKIKIRPEDLAWTKLCRACRRPISDAQRMCGRYICRFIGVGFVRDGI